jgi:hypothetical protein
VSAGKFFGVIIHEHSIEVDLDQIEAIRNVGAPTCKLEMQSFLGKVNYLRRFISNLAMLSLLLFGLKIMPISLGGRVEVGD